MAAEPVTLYRLQIITKILGRATDPGNFRTRDLLRLSRTSTPEIKQASRELQDLIINQVKQGKLDFIAVAKQGADLVEEAQAQINALKDKMRQDQQQSAQLQSDLAVLKTTLEQRGQELQQIKEEKNTIERELAKRPTLKDLEDRQKEIGTLRLADDVLRGRITRRERTIEALQQREVGYLEQIARLQAEAERLRPLVEKTSSLEAENKRLKAELTAKTAELEDFAQTDREDTNIALGRALNEKKEIQANLDAAQQLVTEYREQIDRLTQSGEVVETQSGTLRDELDAAKRRVLVLERSQRETEAQILQLRAEADAALAQRTSERDSARETAKDLQARLTSTSTRLSQMLSFEQAATLTAQENDELRQALADNEAAYARVEREKQREIDRLQSEINMRDDRIDELQREINRLQTSQPTVENQPVTTQGGARELVAGDLLTGGRGRKT